MINSIKLSICSFSCFKISEEWQSPIKEIAIKALKELVVTFLYSIATSYFVATGVSIAPLFLGALAVTITNVFLRILVEYCNPERAEIAKSHYAMVQYLPGVIFAVFDAFTRGILVHEGGHYVAATCLFDTPAKMVLFPFDKAVTQFSLRRLRPLGNSLGRKLSVMITTAAGAGISIVTSMFQLVAAHKCRSSHPELSRYLKMTAFFNVMNHAGYALSSFWTSLKAKPGHDFLLLQKIAGISPIVACIVIVALPLMVQLGLYLAQGRMH